MATQIVYMLYDETKLAPRECRTFAQFYAHLGQPSRRVLIQDAATGETVDQLNDTANVPRSRVLKIALVDDSEPAWVTDPATYVLNGVTHVTPVDCTTFKSLCAHLGVQPSQAVIRDSKGTILRPTDVEDPLPRRDVLQIELITPEDQKLRETAGLTLAAFNFAKSYMNRDDIAMIQFVGGMCLCALCFTSWICAVVMDAVDPYEIMGLGTSYAANPYLIPFFVVRMQFGMLMLVAQPLLYITFILVAAAAVLLGLFVVLTCVTTFGRFRVNPTRASGTLSIFPTWRCFSDSPVWGTVTVAPGVHMNLSAIVAFFGIAGWANTLAVTSLDLDDLDTIPAIVPPAGLSDDERAAYKFDAADLHLRIKGHERWYYKTKTS